MFFYLYLNYFSNINKEPNLKYFIDLIKIKAFVQWSTKNDLLIRNKNLYFSKINHRKKIILNHLNIVHCFHLSSLLRGLKAPVRVTIGTRPLHSSLNSSHVVRPPAWRQHRSTEAHDHVPKNIKISFRYVDLVSGFATKAQS